MGSGLVIRLLGGLTIEQDEEIVTGLVTRKAEVLLAYLAVERRPHGRENLATLFWDDRSQEQALSNLRTLLTSLRRHLEPYLMIDRATVALNPARNVWVDSVAFEDLTNSQAEAMLVEQLEEAVALYRGEFLEGVFVRESQGLEEWAALRRERLRQQAAGIRQRLALQCLHRREYVRGIEHAQALIALDPLRESNHRLLMRLLGRSGQLNAALAHFSSCRQLLADELGVEPSTETLALYERIRQARQLPPHQLPVQFTPFVGRATELGRISQWLDDPNCRLLTITGPGGIGKTRLAIQAAEARRGDYLNGIYFVSLEEVDSADNIPVALAVALDVAWESHLPPTAQLLDYLRPKEMLLVLDNFEHLLPAGIALLRSLMTAAPDVQLLITSRERLQLQAEWVLPLGGLTYPQTAEETATVAYESLQLFTTAANRALAGEMLVNQKLQSVAELCRLLDGLPLGIELAAAALPYYPLEQLLAGLHQEMDVPTTGGHDLPDRHRSLGALFAHAWKLLAPAEQQVMQALALFQGGFDLEAAQMVAGADLRVLTNLISKSWLRHDGRGRYTLHPLLRQHAQKKAGETGQAMIIAGQHAHYYAQRVAGYAPWLQGGRQQEAVAALLVELGNVTNAWRWLVAQMDTTQLFLMLNPLYRFFQMSSRLQQGIELFEPAVAAAETPALAAHLCCCLAAFQLQLGEYEAADVHLQQAWQNADVLVAADKARIRQLEGELARLQARYVEAETAYQEALALSPEPAVAAEAYLGLGRLAIPRLQPVAGREQLEAALALYQSLVDQWGIAEALRWLGTLAEHRGDYEEAEQRLLASLAMRRTLGDRRGLVSTLNALGNVSCVRDEYEQNWRKRGERPFEDGRRYYEEGLAIAREIGARPDIAILLGDLGTIYVEWGEDGEALRLFEECKAISQALGDELGVVFARRQIGTLALRRGQLAAAERELKAVLQQGLAVQASREVLYALMEWGKLQALAQPEWGAALLKWVIAQPDANQEMRDDAGRALAKLNLNGLLPELPRPGVTSVGDVVAWALATGPAATS
jgi:predicted ATPase/DNA-binding SARP family transcriptional activator